MNIAITGANGFVGSHLFKLINDMGHTVISISRSNKNKLDSNSYTFDDFFSLKIKQNIDCFLHLASPNFEYSEDDTLEKGITCLTSKILSVLASYNCKKFIFFSSAKVYGEPSLKHEIFLEDTKPKPITDYGKEKLKAENEIKYIASNSDLKYIIYRMPMVYGFNNFSNIGKLLKFIKNSYPFPLFKNSSNLKKSFLSIENIQLYVEFNIKNPESINNEILNITDEKSISINDLIINSKMMFKSKSYIIYLPYFVLKMIVKLPVVCSYFLKLYGKFEISNKKINDLYGLECKDTISCINNMHSHKN